MYGRALDLEAENAGLWSNYGQFLFAEKRWKEAQAAFEKALELRPQLPEPHNNLANLYSRQQRWHRAISLYERALELRGGKGSEILGNLGDTYRLMGDRAAARHHLDRAISQDSTRASLFYFRGKL